MHLMDWLKIVLPSAVKILWDWAQNKKRMPVLDFAYKTLP